MVTSVQSQEAHRQNILLEIYNSFRALPVWVQIWVFFLLVPINMASLAFVFAPMGVWIAFLANIAMLMNLPVMLRDRGFSKFMALPHLLPWTILVTWLLFWRPEATGAYDIYLWILLVTDLVSLAFDYPDAVKWYKGDRTPAGR